jgi:hypothetical protein
MASIGKDLDKIAVTGDSRIRSEVALLNGKSYGTASESALQALVLIIFTGYLIAEPESGFYHTILLARNVGAMTYN